MEKMMMKPKPLNNPPGSANSANNKLAMHKDSHVIAKLKPKIRIIHVFAPEIIKTDAANFRQLVQSLTGKGAGDARGKDDHRAQNRKGFRSTDDDQPTSKKTVDQKRDDDQFPVVIKKEEAEENLWSGDHDEKMINSSSFLDGFSDLDGFIDEISEFRSFPLRSSSRMDRVFHEDPN
ncbi:VQ motif-containing protein 17 [Morus notabilis]|nr:VQ motif-containing protein 17 [Morus notabilis]